MAQSPGQQWAASRDFRAIATVTATAVAQTPAGICTLLAIPCLPLQVKAGMMFLGHFI